VTLAQLGQILATPELKVQRALNLDGGSSSAFWFNGDGGAVSIPEQKTVRDFVIVTPK
jgi:exopolysaccharide biosynthesis protein